MSIISEFLCKDKKEAYKALGASPPLIAIYDIYMFLYNNGILKDISFCYEDSVSAVDFAFNIKKLIQYKDMIVKSDIENAEYGYNLITKPLPHVCSCCGAKTLLEPMAGIEWSGPIGIETHKCCRCKDLPSNASKQIYHYRLTHSDEETVKRYWLLNKLYGSNNVKIGDFNIEYKQFIDGEHQHYLWYGGEVANISCEDYNFEICAYGDVKTELSENGEYITSTKDKSNNGEFYNRMRNYLINDDDLENAIENYEMYVAENSDVFAPTGKALQIMDSNWFEIVARDNNGNAIDVPLDILDATYINEAVQETLDLIPEIINWIKEDSNG